MHKVALIYITILNLSSYALPNTVLLNGDKVVGVGDLEMGKSSTVLIPEKDSVAIVFKADRWMGTKPMPVRDTIKITDNTQIFEYTFGD